MFLLLAALVVAGLLFRQETEISRLRSTIAELTRHRSDRAAVSFTTTNPLPADIQQLRREAAEIPRLRSEIAQLRRAIVETSALRADIETLSNYVSALTATVNRGASGGTQGASLPEQSPEEAARSVAALPPGEQQNRAALAVIKRWLGSDPLAAATWASQFPEGQLREQATALVAREWGLTDWNATADWLEKLPMGPSRDAAIMDFVTSADGSDIRLALEWANRMESPENRALRVEETARRWLHQDSVAARAWLQKAQLPPGLAEHLLSAE